MKRILVVLSFVACSTPGPSTSSSHEILLLGEPEVSTPEPARATAPAALQGPLKVFFGNLHSHTSYSDGQGIPEDAYRHARDVAGLDFLAVTEHNHRAAPSRIEDEPSLYSGPSSLSLIQTAARFMDEGTFVALYGQEFSSIGSGNHANVLDAPAVIQTSAVPNGRWDKLLLDWLPAHLDSSGQRPLLLLNHPSQSSSPNDKEYGVDDIDDPATAEDEGFDSFDHWRAELDAHAQLINIVNGPSHDGSSPGSPSESEFRGYSQRDNPKASQGKARAADVE